MKYDNFDEWLKAVDFQLDREIGATTGDFLPDPCRHLNWRDGMSPREQAEEIFLEEGYFTHKENTE